MRISYLLLVLVFTIPNSCKVKKGVNEKAINKATVSFTLYNEHKRMLIDSIRSYIAKNEKSYYPKENDSLTRIFIDTIIYSPKEDKAAFFVITQNSNDKLLSKGNSNEFHFDAHCFIALLDKGSFDHIQWLGVYNLTNYTTHKDASERIREIYFNEFKGAQGLFNYNLDDVGFWEDLNVWNGTNKYTQVFEDDK